MGSENMNVVMVPKREKPATLAHKTNQTMTNTVMVALIKK